MEKFLSAFSFLKKAGKRNKKRRKRRKKGEFRADFKEKTAKKERTAKDGKKIETPCFCEK